MASEQYAFVFSVVYILLFSGFTAAIPVDLQGNENTEVNLPVPVDPSLLGGYSDYENFSKAAFSGVSAKYYYYPDSGNLGGYNWECSFGVVADSFKVGALIYFLNIVWLGAVDWAEFTNTNGTNYGTSISFSDIDNDQQEGAAKYTMIFSESGKSAGDFFIYYNSTTYSDSEDAWDNGAIYFVHGVGLTTDTNIASLLLALLFFQLPDMPTLINLMIVAPIWACVVFDIWYIITKMIPLLG